MKQQRQIFIKARQIGMRNHSLSQQARKRLLESYLAAGNCVVCNTEVFRELDGHDPDPRGELGIKYSANTLVAAERDMIGEDVITCFGCGQNSETHWRAVAIGMLKWKHKENYETT